MRDHDPLRIARRDVLAAAAIVPVAAIRSAAQGASSVFSEKQKRCIEAFANRLVPADELGPGAVECGAVEYIDRSLGEPGAGGKEAILAGIDAVDAFALTSQGALLGDLTPDRQDAVLIAMEKDQATGFTTGSAAFFAIVRRLTLEGLFCDPSWGGNRNFAGWDLIRYPGPRLAVSADDQRVGAAVKPVRFSVNGGGNGASHGH